MQAPELSCFNYN